MKKLIIPVTVALVFCLVLVIAANWSLIQHIATFHPIILPSFGPAPTDETEARLQDIE